MEKFRRRRGAGIPRSMPQGAPIASGRAAGPPAGRPPLAYRFLFHTGRPLAALFRLQAAGVERLPPGGLVLSPNQTSNFDGWALAMPLYPRHVRYMAKAELFPPLLGRAFARTGCFPVRRGSPDRRALEQAVALARAGAVIGIFPEGTRRAKGLRKALRPEPHTGAARVALAAGVPLVPVAIAGTDRLSRLAPWRVLYGGPVRLDDLSGLARRAAAREATARLFAAITALEDELSGPARAAR
jgi:1-acyl-sn-glycerol-3-phosphate acyltransferase